MKVIDLDYTFNTRDLGKTITESGLFIKEKRLIRSGSLHKLSIKDIETLKENDVSIVIDFRSQDEFINKPDIKIDNVTYINIPALEKYEVAKNDNLPKEDANLLYLVDKKTGGKVLLKNTYKSLFDSKVGIEAFKSFFKIILENKSGAILWHCSQGKDRAGMAAFLLEYALGIPMNECINDYLYTNIAMEKKIKQLTPLILKISNNDESLLPILKEVFIADLSYLNVALDTINKNYGSIDNLLVNVLNVDIEKLRSNYLSKE